MTTLHASPDRPLEQLPGATRYMEQVQRLLQVIAETQTAAIDAAATAITQALRNGGQLYLFGTGHSHMLAEEGHYRAGGLAPVCPILSSALMLHEGAVTSTLMERTSGLGPAVLARYPVGPEDVIMIFSNSGVNAVPVETALAAKQRGMTVIAVVARAYAATVAPGPSGKKLADVADIVIDNQGVPGDALVEIGSSGLRTGPSSTVAGAFILNAILTEVAWRLANVDGEAPIYISANMPNAAAHNAALVQRFRSRNPHL
ncbi:MAG: SIS domain-containing protein [Caldilinea sp.]|uniref:SIS domain-containing protein n=1 Tax=Caldilinea sp. TaxID=2293560 RepID=UPI003099187F